MLPGSLRRAWTGSLGADSRLAARRLLRQPGSALAIIASLALGIGVTTAVFALFNFVLFRPVPGVFREGNLVSFEFRSARNGAGGYGETSALPALRAASGSAGLIGLGAVGGASEIAVTALPERVAALEHVEFVSRDYLAVLSLQTTRGRLLTDAEAESAAADVADISEDLWRRRFDGANDIVGRELLLNGHAATIVGVITRFRGWQSTPVGETDIWLPIALEKRVTGTSSSLNTMIGRPRPGASVAAIEERIQAAYALIAPGLPAREAAFTPFAVAGLSPLNRQQRDAVRLYRLLMMAVGGLLLLACANAANLLLARASDRQRDTAVRLALGSSRARVARQLLIESMALAGFAAVGGLGVARIFVAALSGLRLLRYFPDLRGVEIDHSVQAFAVAAALVTVALFGLGPALATARLDLQAALNQRGRAVSGSPRLRSLLLLSQLSLSIVLVAGGGILNQSLQHLLSTDLGLDAAHVLDLSMRPDDAGYERTASAAILARTMSALHDAGFAHVAMAYGGALPSNLSMIRMQAPAMLEPTRLTVADTSITSDFFATVGLPLLSGRTFTEAETRQGEGVEPLPLVVNVTLARRLFGTTAAIGRTFHVERFSGMAVFPSTALVIGVVTDARPTSIRGEPVPAFYHARTPSRRYAEIFVRFDGSPVLALERVRDVASRIDPRVPVRSLDVLQDAVASGLGEERLLARLSALLALTAGLLAMTGVLAVTLQLVADRRREFGIRAALGASPADIVRHILGGTLKQAAIGIGVGLAAYAGVSRTIAADTYGIGVLDPWTLVSVCAGVAMLAVGAAFFPARRASGSDPSIALRAD